MVTLKDASAPVALQPTNMVRSTKDKPRRNSEKRREKSRDAARQRRSQETNVFTELAKNLPLSENTSSHLDKASIMRLTLATLKQSKIKSFFNKSKEKKKDAIFDSSYDEITLSLQHLAMDGFLLIISQEKEIIYISEQVSNYLGIQQIEYLGQNILDYLHPNDQDEFQKVFRSKDLTERISLFLRMKSTLNTKGGRNVQVKSPTYKVIKFTGKIITSSDEPKKNVLEDDDDDDDNSPGGENDNPEGGGTPKKYLLALGEPIPHPANIEVPLGCKTFLSQHSLDMKFTTWDQKIEDVAGYDCKDMIGRTIYDYCHVLDSYTVGQAFQHLMHKGQIMTDEYRFLSKSGGYIWVVTQATIIYEPRSLDPQYVVCVHYVLSETQHPEQIYSTVQQPPPVIKKNLGEDIGVESQVLEDGDNDIVILDNTNVMLKDVEPYPVKRTGPQLNTENIFAPKTQDMDEDCLTYTFPTSECPQELQNRAPSAGDVCISLPFETYAYEFKLTDNLDLTKMKEEAIENRNIYLWKPNDEYSFQQSPHIELFTQTSCDSVTQENISIMETEEIPQCLKSDEEIIVENALMDTNQSVITYSSPKDEQKTLNNPSEWGLNKLFPPWKFDPYRNIENSPESLVSDSQQEGPDSQQTRPDPQQIGADSQQKGLNSQQTGPAPQQKNPVYQRPLDGAKSGRQKRQTNNCCLETGPPMKRQKIARYSSFEQSNEKPCVLHNLLTSGEDLIHGYRVISPVVPVPDTMTELFKKQSINPSNQLLLPCLTQSDCDVNAPALSNGLLQGKDIINALDRSPVII